MTIFNDSKKVGILLGAHHMKTAIRFARFFQKGMMNKMHTIKFQIKQPCEAAKSVTKMVYKCHTSTC